MEITKQLDIDPQHEQILTSHSILNILNLLQFNFLRLSDLLNDEKDLLPLYGSVQELAALVSKKRVGEQESKRIRGLYSHVLQQVHSAIEEVPEHGRMQAEAFFSSIKQIIEVLHIRLDELERMQAAGTDVWIAYLPDELHEDLRAFFRAVELNSQGAYRIVDNIALKDDRSYFIDLSFHATSSGKIYMPLLVKDVFRDVIANARKYTDPGGNILAGVFQDTERLKLVVEDNGRGIPTESIENVVDFGVRAGNAVHKTSYGGGFGLTKAYYLTRKFGGRMWIESEVGHFTRVKITIPNQR